MSFTNLPPTEPLLGALTVADAMRSSVPACAPSASLREIAGLLAEHNTPCTVIMEAAGGRPGPRIWGVVSELDLMRGLGSPLPLVAANIARLDVITVSPDDALQRAAQLMGEHDATHLIVVEDCVPAGVVSALDVARAVAAPSRNP